MKAGVSRITYAFIFDGFSGSQPWHRTISSGMQHVLGGMTQASVVLFCGVFYWFCAKGIWQEVLGIRLKNGAHP